MVYFKRTLLFFIFLISICTFVFADYQLPITRNIEHSILTNDTRIVFQSSSYPYDVLVYNVNPGNIIVFTGEPIGSLSDVRYTFSPSLYSFSLESISSYGTKRFTSADTSYTVTVPDDCYYLYVCVDRRNTTFKVTVEGNGFQYSLQTVSRRISRDSLWFVFTVSVKFILIVVAFSFGFYLIIYFIKKISRGG